MVIYSKLAQPRAEPITLATEKSKAMAADTTSLQTEDPLVARETIFYDHAGRIIPDLVYYDTITHRGKKRLKNGELKECFIKKVRVSIGEFGINRLRVNDEPHLEAIKEVIKIGVQGKARAEMVREIEERIRERARQRGKPIQ